MTFSLLTVVLQRGINKKMTTLKDGLCRIQRQLSVEQFEIFWSHTTRFSTVCIRCMKFQSRIRLV